MIDEAYMTCQKILTTHMDQLHKIANALMEEEKLDGDRFETLINQTNHLLEGPVEQNTELTQQEIEAGYEEYEDDKKA
jgi:hypothetical protein